jgi:hypothetical protein
VANLSVGEVLDRLRATGAKLELVDVDGVTKLDVRGEGARPLIDDLRAHRNEVVRRLTPPASFAEAEANLIEAFGEIDIAGYAERRILTHTILEIATMRRELRARGVPIPRTTFAIAECPDCDGLSISTRRRADLERRCPHCPSWQGRDDDSKRGKRRRVLTVVISESDHSRPAA